MEIAEEEDAEAEGAEAEGAEAVGAEAEDAEAEDAEAEGAEADGAPEDEEVHCFLDVPDVSSSSSLHKSIEVAGLTSYGHVCPAFGCPHLLHL